MKKIISLILAMIMVLSMGVTAFADEFIDSIERDYGAISAKIINESGEELAVLELGEECLVVTHITEADDADSAVTEEAKILKEVYKKLVSGELVPDFEKAGFDPEKMVLIDLYDATLVCDEHPEQIAPERILIEITFKVNVDAGKNVCAMAYKNNEWLPAEKVVNNGDNTVTVTIEHLCPIVFAVEEGSGTEEDNPNTGSSVAIGMVALVSAAAAAISFKRK